MIETTQLNLNDKNTFENDYVNTTNDINYSNNNNNTNNNNNNDHYNPSVRLLQIPKTSAEGSCGFHLSRSKWDPYPWVSAVDVNTPAELTGLKVGDCVLEVNGEDILGLRISDIAQLVKTRNDSITLLLWSSGQDPSCNSESLCCGPMPLNLERLSASVQTILSSLECPVCLDAIPPPVLQCQNGHILCLKCRARSERCPICRQRYSCVRSLVAEQIYSSILTSFKLNDDFTRIAENGSGSKLREKLFGAKYKKKPHFEGNRTNIQTPTNKFLAKILGKAHSLDSLSQNTEKQKKSNENAGMENIAKGKHFSLSTNDLPTTTSEPRQKNESYQNVIAIPRCPFASRIHSDERVVVNDINSLNLNGVTLSKRPLSLNASIESLSVLMSSTSTVTIPVPYNRFEKLLYLCPFEDCKLKFEDKTLEAHIKIEHNTPIISFGTSSTEMLLPLKPPIENAVLVLTLDDNKLIWIKLKIDRDGNILVFALLQDTEEESLKYMLEARLKNQVESKLLERELIARSIVYSMVKNQWNKIEKKSIDDENTSSLGIIYNQDNIRTTYKENSQLLLKIDVMQRNNE